MYLPSSLFQLTYLHIRRATVLLCYLPAASESGTIQLLLPLILAPLPRLLYLKSR